MNKKALNPKIVKLLACVISLSYAVAEEPGFPNQNGQQKGLAGNVSSRKADQFSPVNAGEVKLHGLLGKHLDRVPSRLTKGQREAYMEPFKHPVDTNSWRAEHIGKWLETACNTAEYRHDGELRESADDVVQELIRLQQKDGWLGSYAPSYRFQNYDWEKNKDKKYVPFYDGPFYDVWCHYLTMGGLIRHHETTGSREALEAAEKIGSLLIDTFGPGKQDLMLINHDHGFGPAVAIWPMSKLYLLTGDKKYLKFCEYVVSQYGRKGKVPIIVTRETKEGYPFPEWAHIKHCELELCLTGLGQLYQATDDPAYLATCENIYSGYFKPLNETMSVHGFKVPLRGMQVPDTYYRFLETCDIVPMMRWYVEMARITGNPEFMDAVEWNIYNALLSRDIEDGRVWPGVDLPQTNIFHCCYSMMSVGMSLLPSWVYLTNADTVFVNLYESSECNTVLNGSQLRIQQTTEYPLDGDVRIEVSADKPAKGTIALRIPKWCRDAKVMVNGRSIESGGPESGKWVRISRDWGSKDIVSIKLDMSARAMRRDFSNSSKGAVFIERGPLLLAMTKKLNPGVNVPTATSLIDESTGVDLEPLKSMKATEARDAVFRSKGVVRVVPADVGKRGADSVLLTPYAYAGVSEKPMPPERAGVFNVYSEDGVGDAVRVEFEIPRREAAMK